ncbi:MAG: FixH family protein [Candidatus Eremiobacteraeota bacterium]|nr:FixH family protein [Candidatus Eremiobacteraeota bacterium]
MQKVFTVIAALTLLAGCSTKTGSAGSSNAPVSSSGDFSMTLAFEPTPPKQGAETLTLTIKDSNGNPVKGASLTIATTMPAMSMTGPSLKPQNNGDGTYSVVTNLNYGTKWVFDVTASAAGKYGKAEFAQDVP